MDNNTPPTTPPVVSLETTLQLLTSLLKGETTLDVVVDGLNLTPAQIGMYDVHSHFMLFMEPWFTLNGGMTPLEIVETIAGLHHFINND